MDVGDGKPGTKVMRERCDRKKASQKYSLLPSGQIRTAAGRCLELSEGKGLPHFQPNTLLVVGRECKDTGRPPEQQFRYEPKVMDQLFSISGQIRATGGNCVERRSTSPRLFMQKCGN